MREQTQAQRRTLAFCFGPFLRWTLCRHILLNAFSDILSLSLPSLHTCRVQAFNIHYTRGTLRELLDFTKALSFVACEAVAVGMNLEEGR